MSLVSKTTYSVEGSIHLPLLLVIRRGHNLSKSACVPDHGTSTQHTLVIMPLHVVTWASIGLPVCFS